MDELKKLLADSKTGKPRSVRELRELRGERVKLMEKLAGEFRSNGGTWASDEARQAFEKASDEQKFLMDAIDVLEREQAALMESRGMTAPGAGFGGALLNQNTGGRSHLEPVLEFKDLANGRVIRALRSHEPLAQRQRKLSSEDTGDGGGDDCQPHLVGRCLQSLLLNRPEILSDHERRDLLGGSDTAGGYLLSGSVSAMVLDLARSASVCLRAGAMTLPLENAEMKLVRLTGDATSHWRHEGTAIAATSPVFDALTLRPRTLGCIIPVSIELLEDAPNVAAILEAALANAMALKLDQAALLGPGSAAEPLGILNCPGVNATTSVGTPTDWSDFSGAIGDLLTANYSGDLEKLAWVMHPTDWETIDNLVETGTGAPLRPTPWCSKPRRFATTSLTAGTGVIGDFSQLVIGLRTRGIVFQILDGGQATDDAGITHNGVTEMKKFVRAYLRADVAVLRPAHFSTLAGITTGE
jgi:HK97 family phage major capsid protein